MEIDGIPALAADEDFSKIKPINHKKLLAYINYYITHTVDFVNRFSSISEERLEEVAVRLHKLEVAMKILEAKLSSIPGLETISAASQDQQIVQQPQDHVNPSDDQIKDQKEDEEEEPATQESDYVAVKNDPRYKKYFTMLRVGVRLEAIQAKMVQDGLDPGLLETPDKAVPDGDGALVKHGSDSEEDFGSMDENNSSDGFSD